jgi:uncharacterized DUF497 family protein
MFIWDIVKAKINIVKHGISFEIACGVFFDLNALEVDVRVVQNEKRYLRLGKALDERVLVVVYTLRRSSYGEEKLELLVQGKLQKKSVKHMKDSEINFEDIPELTDGQLKSARRVGRPRGQNNKKMIAFRIDPKILARVKKLANKKKKPYQRLIHELIESGLKTAA